MAFKKQNLYIEKAYNNCMTHYDEDSIAYRNYENRSTCPPFWDKVLCWPATPAGTLASQPCPDYFYGFDKAYNATRQCLSNAQWFMNPHENNVTSWTNYTQCYSTQLVTVIVDLPSPINSTIYKDYMPIIKNISRTGYFVSLITLLVAFCIMFCIKKLHCARNKLHMHLFASFIFRAAMFFTKDFLFVQGVGLSSDLLMKEGEFFFVEQLESNNWQCKMFTSIWQYFITANYSWILMEGLYLHNLILLALFSDSTNSIKYYILFGWGLPAIVVGLYVISRLIIDDTLCWTTYETSSSFLIIRIPTIISNIINFILFINIARVLLLKLRSPVSEEAKLYRRWARSTLVLVPLFGVHYALFVGMSYAIGINETVELIWLFCDQLFASFQGFFVAVLYCFLNGEVKTELRPHISNFISLWMSAPFCIFFNCGDLSRSTRGRPSVCTTLSCSSIYNSTVTQRYQNRRSKWDISQPNEKCWEGCENCEKNSKPCADHFVYWNSKYSQQYDPNVANKCTENYCFCTNGGMQPTEITACLRNCDHNTKSEANDLEMITIVNQ